MREREVLAEGQIAVESDVTADRVNVRIAVSRDATATGNPAPSLARADPILDWAQVSLPINIMRMLDAQLLAISLHISQQVATDPDTGRIYACWDHDALLAVLENCSIEEFAILLGATDVVNGMIAIFASGDRSERRRLERVLRRGTAGAPGAPRKDAEARVDLATAREVAETERAIAEPFEFVKALPRTRRRSAVPLLRQNFRIEPREAAILVESRTRRHAAIRIVAEQYGREEDTVRRAAARGAKHPDFISPE